jgi:adenylate cyclase
MAGTADRPVERKLAAIFAADIAGYSRLMGADEAGTFARLKSCRELIDRLIAEHRGRIFNTAGDSVVADFASAVDAAACAVAVQAAISTEDAARAGNADPGEPMLFRIGIHVGDVIVDGANLLGDGVNIAARLEGLAEPGAVCVSGAARDQIGNKLPITFDDLGDQQVKNIAQPIRVYRVGKTLTHPAADAPGSPLSSPGLTRGSAGEGAERQRREPGEGSLPLPLPDKPSIAVLPFQNISGDPEQEYFVDGMVEEIITALSHIHWLFVIARNSTFTYKGRAVDVKEVGRELGVRYVLEGSVRKAGNRVRITGQLIDALTGTHLWADRFDGSLEDVFELQDKIAVSVAGVIEPALQAAEMRRSAARPTTDLSAYDLYLRALTAFFPIRKEGLVTALGLLEQAVAIDPRYAPALSWAAICHLRLITEGWTEAPESNRQKAIDLARRARQVGENDPRVLANAAVVLGNLGEDIGAMMGLVDRALTLNPSFARGWNLSGLLRVFAGQHDLAIEHIETALRLSPRERVGVPQAIMGAAYFFKHRFAEAEAKLLLAIQEHPETPNTYRTLAASYAHMGRLDEARAVVANLRAITPRVIPNHLAFRRPEDRELLLSGLRLAMGEVE